MIFSSNSPTSKMSNYCFNKIIFMINHQVYPRETSHSTYLVWLCFDKWNRGYRRKCHMHLEVILGMVTINTSSDASIIQLLASPDISSQIRLVIILSELVKQKMWTRCVVRMRVSCQTTKKEISHSVLSLHNLPG